MSGKRKDALKCAQEGQLWGPALILARQLGEKVRLENFYGALSSSSEAARPKCF